MPWARLTDWSAAPSRSRRRVPSPSPLDAGPCRVDRSRSPATRALRGEPKGRGASSVPRVPGLSPRRTAGQPDVLQIPMHGGIDSLNVAAVRPSPAMPWPAHLASRAPRRDRPVLRIAVRQLLVLAVELLPGAAGQPVAEDDAVQVVGLVLQAAGQQPGAVMSTGSPSRPARGRWRSPAGRGRRRRRAATGSPRRPRRAGGPCPRADRPPGCTGPRRGASRRRRGSRRRRRPGRRRPGSRRGRRRRRRAWWRTCRAPACAGRRRTR